MREMSDSNNKLEGQIELFPLATEQEIEEAKVLLEDHRNKKEVIRRLQSKNLLDLQNKRAYNAYLNDIERIETAVGLITESDVRRIIEKRYIHGLRNKDTVIYFGNMVPSTVNRKINEGIESVANSLKTWEL
jgi:hypothetical protein